MDEGAAQQQGGGDYWAQSSIPVRIAREKLKCALALVAERSTGSRLVA